MRTEPPCRPERHLPKDYALVRSRITDRSRGRSEGRHGRDTILVAAPGTYVAIYGMKRTTLYLPADLKATVQRAATAQNTSEAEVIRSALRAATAPFAHPAPRLPLFDSGDPSLAERVDELLAGGFGE